MCSSQQSDLRLWWSGVQNTGPHETAGKVDYGLDVLLIRFDVCGDQTLLLGDTPLLCLTVDGGEALVAAGLLATLDKDEHVLPVGVDDGLGGKGQIAGTEKTKKEDLHNHHAILTWRILVLLQPLFCLVDLCLNNDLLGLL